MESSGDLNLCVHQFEVHGPNIGAFLGDLKSFLTLWAGKRIPVTSILVHKISDNRIFVQEPGVCDESGPVDLRLDLEGWLSGVGLARPNYVIFHRPSRNTL